MKVKEAYEHIINGNNEIEAMSSYIDYLSLVRDEPSSESCYQTNPELWRIFCTLNKREFSPNHVWSEADVIMWIDSHLETAENNKRVNLLKDLMSQLKLTKTGCAKMLDINERTVYRWLSGERQVPIIVLSLLRAELLLRKHGISIEQDGCVG